MRLRLLALTLSGVLVASSACSDATAPSGLAAPARASASERQDQERHSDQGGGWSPPTSYQVTIDPTRRNVLRFGPHTLSLPANSMCRLDGSAYSLFSLDDPCTAETHRVTIEATVSTDAQGHSRIDLQPSMRFDPAKTVVLSTYIGRAAMLSANNWRIFFCPDAYFQGCVDESLFDPSLTTYVDLEHWLVYRRIKHFSGYFTADS